MKFIILQTNMLNHIIHNSRQIICLLISVRMTTGARGQDGQGVMVLLLETVVYQFLLFQGIVYMYSELLPCRKQKLSSNTSFEKYPSIDIIYLCGFDRQIVNRLWTFFFRHSFQTKSYIDIKVGHVTLQSNDLHVWLKNKSPNV